MTQQTNDYGQPVGQSLSGWTARDFPTATVLNGQYCRLEKIDFCQHVEDLFNAYQSADNGQDWTYLSVGPFDNRQDFDRYIQQLVVSEDPRHYAVIDNLSGKALGTLALMRIDRNNGVVEVGFVVYSPLLKQTRIATEAQYLLMAYAFDKLGYRRYEWKCDALNAPSRAAALRLGFRYEGLFRNAVVYKGRSRDTAWFSIVEAEWPDLKRAYTRWLSTENFDEKGQQRIKLAELTRL